MCVCKENMNIYLVHLLSCDNADIEERKAKFMLCCFNGFAYNSLFKCTADYLQIGFVIKFYSAIV